MRIGKYTEQQLLKYESVVTNVLTGLFFGASLLAARTVIEEMVAPRFEGRELPPCAATLEGRDVARRSGCLAASTPGAGAT